MHNAEGDHARMSSKRQLPSGFTLLELLITLAVSAILIGLAMPSMQSLLGDSEMTSTSNEFVYSLQTARSEAIKRAGPVGLCPSTAPEADEPVCDGSDYARGWIVFFDADGNGSRETTDQIVLQAEERPSRFTFTPDTAFAQRIYFGPSGTSINPAGVPLSGVINIRYSSGEEQRTVRIAANGRIKTINPAAVVSP